MSEFGIDISNNSSNHIDEYINENIDLVLTVCDNAKEICPIFPKETDFIHYSFEDPADAKGTHKEKLVIYEKVRDEIHNFIKSEFIDIINNRT